MNSTTNTAPKSRMAQGGSFHNRLDEVAVRGQPIPEPGMGATRLCYSDRHACTIVFVEMNANGDRKRIGIKADRAIRTDNLGMSDHQEYRYESDMQAGTQWYTIRKTGQWIREGDSLKGGEVLKIGVRDHHHDYSF